MPWFLVDDQFHSHPKVIAARAEDPGAIGLWAIAGSWTAAYVTTTDGVIPHEILPTLYPDAVRLAAILVDKKLWKTVRGGHKFVPGVTHKMPTKDAVDKERKDAAERQRRSREARSSRRDRPVSDGVSPAAHTDALKPPTPSPAAMSCPRHHRPRPDCASCQRPPPHPSDRTVAQAIAESVPGTGGDTPIGRAAWNAIHEHA